jgi:hypothetical protein
MNAKLIDTDGEEGGVVVLSIGGIELRAMNCLGYGQSSQRCPKTGEEFRATFSCQPNGETTWESFFGGNPHREQKLESTGQWSYKVYGKLVSAETSSNEAQVDCGVCCISAPIEVSDPACIGEFVFYEISRLDVWRA